MAVVIALAPELEQKLRDRAAAAGVDADTFAREAIEEKLNGPKTLREILAPLHQEFRENPMSAENLDHVIDECRDEVWRERQSSKGQ
jgi:hypothetical protein